MDAGSSQAAHKHPRESLQGRPTRFSTRVQAWHTHTHQHTPDESLTDPGQLPWACPSLPPPPPSDVLRIHPRRIGASSAPCRMDRERRRCQSVSATRKTLERLFLAPTLLRILLSIALDAPHSAWCAGVICVQGDKCTFCGARREHSGSKTCRCCAGHSALGASTYGMALDEPPGPVPLCHCRMPHPSRPK